MNDTVITVIPGISFKDINSGQQTEKFGTNNIKMMTIELRSTYPFLF